MSKSTKVYDDDTTIHLPRSEIDDETYALTVEMAKSPVFNHIRLMPDCHSCSYCCVGMTSIIENKVIPQIVGGDIGCGISCINLHKVLKEKHYEKIDNAIKNMIPMGERNHQVPITTPAIMNSIYTACNETLEKLKRTFPTYPFADFQYNENYYNSMISRARSNVSSNNYLKSMGTLGGGNHYIEINKEENGNCHLTVHCGSRHMGQAICNYHQEKIRRHRDYDKKHFLLNYLENDELVEYLIDMVFAQEFASMNRTMIMYMICNELGCDFSRDKAIDTVHNYIDFDRMILRKGSISAEEGELCIISLNMRDGILICRGKGNPDWNYSSAHGCGRLMSRRNARMSFTMKQYRDEMKDVYSSCVCKDTLDEIPNAYKNPDLIASMIGDSVDIIKHLKPIINIKGY